MIRAWAVLLGFVACAPSHPSVQEVEQRLAPIRCERLKVCDPALFKSLENAGGCVGLIGSPEGIGESACSYEALDRCAMATAAAACEVQGLPPACAELGASCESVRR